MTEKERSLFHLMYDTLVETGDQMRGMVADFVIPTRLPDEPPVDAEAIWRENTKPDNVYGFHRIPPPGCGGDYVVLGVSHWNEYEKVRGAFSDYSAVPQADDFLAAQREVLPDD